MLPEDKRVSFQTMPSRKTIMAGEKSHSSTMLSVRSSIAHRAQMANASVNSNRLWGVGAVVVSSLAIGYPLVFCILEFGIFGGNTEWPAYQQQLEGQPESTDELGVTDTVPTSNLAEGQFGIYLASVMWMTMVITGLGLEVLVWLSFLQGSWTQEMETNWRVAQFLFPILVSTAIGLALTHNFLAMPIAVFAMWKFGFPETILYIYAGLYHKHHSYLHRAMDLMNGVGTIFHHSAAALYVAAIVTEAYPATRDVAQVALPLLMQHWFVMLKYYNTWAYVVPELILEAWYEWTNISSLETIYEVHWVGGVVIGVMLCAHWLYLIAGALSLVIGETSRHVEDLIDTEPMDADAGSSRRLLADLGVVEEEDKHTDSQELLDEISLRKICEEEDEEMAIIQQV